MTQPDLVDEFYIPYVRPLGNLLVLFAQAEAALLELVTQLLAGDEAAAVGVLKKPDHPQQIERLLRDAILPDHVLAEVLQTLSAFWTDKDARNRLVHDEWFVGLDPEAEPVWSVETRGFPKKKRQRG